VPPFLVSYRPTTHPECWAIVWRFGFLSVAAGMNIVSKINWKQ